MDITRKAEAEWQGSVREGSGQIALESGAFSGPYSFIARFEGGNETNPEELLGASHAACFTMALSAALGKAGFTPIKITSSAAVTLAQDAGGYVISKIDLTTRAQVPVIEDKQFVEIALDAKKNCPVSKALAGVATISLDAELVSK